jgi:hypothetical protein
VRIYTPLDAPVGLFPCLVYLHGGGWVLGSLEGYETLCRTLANRTRCPAPTGTPSKRLCRLRDPGATPRLRGNNVNGEMDDAYKS